MDALILIAEIVLGFVALILFIYFGILVPVFMFTNMAKLKHFHFLAEKYGFDDQNKMNNYSIVNPSIEGVFKNRKLKIYTILSKDYAHAQKNRIPITKIELTLKTHCSLKFNIEPHTWGSNGNRRIYTGVEEFDKNIIMDSGNANITSKIFSPALIEKFLELKNNFGRRSLYFNLKNNLLTIKGVEPLTTLKRRENAELLIDVMLMLAERIEGFSSEYQSEIPNRS